MAAVHINDEEFKDEVLNSKTPVMVDFYAQWCGPCQQAAPILDSLADELKEKIKIVKMDVDQTNTARNYGVMSIPTVVMFVDGEEKDRKIGFGGEQGYREMIQKVI